MTDMEKEVIVILENEMVDTMLEIYREIYGEYVIYTKNGKNTYMFASARRCTERSMRHSYNTGNYQKN